MTTDRKSEEQEIRTMRRMDALQERAIERDQESVKRVQCDCCNGYEDEDVADQMTLCVNCRAKLEHYDRLLAAVKEMGAETNADVIPYQLVFALRRFIAKEALKYCGENL